jgi:hypothetical protein
MDTVKSLPYFGKEQAINHKRMQRIMQREELQCRVKANKRKPTG